MSNKLLVIGKLPPPIGGVTIHVDRLLTYLDEHYKNYEFVKLTIVNLLFLPIKLFKYKFFHLHSSNVYIRFFCVVLGKLLNSKSIITIHGDLGRFNSTFKNFIDKCSVKLATIPIVLNELSYSSAVKLNKNTKIISAFIPPIDSNEQLSEVIIKRILNLKSIYGKVYCTNASRLSFDRSDIEIYGIFEIINYFTENQNEAIVISDPSGNYLQEFTKKSIILPDNILLIVEPHSFYLILKMSDYCIRNTSTDGDSLSVKESLFLNKITFCTNVVSRPKGAVLYKRGELSQILHSNKNNSIKLFTDSAIKIKNGAIDLIVLYEELKSKNNSNEH